MPFGLSVDYLGKKIYWSDANFGKLQYSDFNGQNLVTLLSSGLGTPVNLAVYKLNVFFVDTRLASVLRVSKFYSAAPQILRSNLNGMHHIKIWATDYQTQVDGHPCARQNGDCSHFCFPVSSPDPQYAISRHCGCPYGMKLDTNGMTCVPNPDEREVNTCQAPYYFKCSNERCIR